MAEPESQTAIVKSALGEEVLTVKDFDASGKSQVLSAPMPTSLDFNTWSLMQQAVMLKKYQWKNISIAEIIWGLCYAKSKKADVTQGEIFSTGNGRFGESNGYRIRMAKESPAFNGIEFTFADLPDDLPASMSKCSRKKDLACTVKVYVKGWEKPITVTHKLSQWYKNTDPWNNMPDNQLLQNTCGHACRFVPGVLSDSTEEAPTEEIAKEPVAGMAAQLRKQAEEQDLVPVLEASLEAVGKK